MSNYVKEILKDLKNNPETFQDYNGQGVQKKRLVLAGFGNTAILSIVSIFINGKSIPTSYLDRFKIEIAIRNWYRTVPLNVITND
jgi:hypothetical protein